MKTYNLQNIKAAYIAYATDTDMRFKGSSGGVGSALINYLFDSNKIQSAITLKYNVLQYKYEPMIIYRKEDYLQSGSVYHDINIPKFISDNVDEIKGCIAVFCPPCFVKIVRSIFKKHSIENIIISFACSGQTNIEGTYFYYKCLGIKKEDVAYMQYRGNGFPSGIQITLKDGTKIFRKNWTYPWNIIQQSRFFRPKRCFFCEEQMSVSSDFSVADPWLSEYKSDNQGYSILTVNNERAEKIFEALCTNKIIYATKIGIETVIKSQLGKFKEKANIKMYLSFYKKEYKILRNTIYRKIVLSNIYFLKCHNYLFSKLKSIFQKSHE